MVFAARGELRSLYGVTTIPAVAVIDADGVVRYRGTPWDVEPILEELLGD